MSTSVRTGWIPVTDRTLVDLLGERSRTVIERLRTPRSDQVTRELLAFSIAEIDREIARRHTSPGATP